MNNGGSSALCKRLVTLFAALLLAVPGTSRADHAFVPAAETVSISMDELVASIALYPDDLLSVALAASTFPSQVDQAGGFLVQLTYDPELKPDPRWDDSVVALLNYPDVVALMTADLEWTRRLGEAVRERQSEVIDAVQRFRKRAVLAGNLGGDERQAVTDNAGVIEITPANPGAIYVPHYDPGRVIYRSSAPVYHYYPDPYPSYSYPYPGGHPSGFGYFWGVTSVFSIAWHGRHLSVFRHTHSGGPYTGHGHFRQHSHSSFVTGFSHGRRLKGPGRPGHRSANRRATRDGNRRADGRATSRPDRATRGSARRGRGSANRRTTRRATTTQRSPRRNAPAARGRTSTGPSSALATTPNTTASTATRTRRQEARRNRQARRRSAATTDSINASSAQSIRTAESARSTNRTRATRSTRRSSRKQRRRRSRTRAVPTTRAETAVQARIPKSSPGSEPNRAESKRRARAKSRGRATKRARARREKANRAARRVRGERS